MQWNCLHCSRSDKVGAYITAVHVLLLAAWSAQLHAAVSARCVRLFPVWTVVESVSSTARKVAAYPSLVLAEQQHDLIAVDFSRNSCFIFFSQHLMFTADISSGLFSRTTWVSWYQKGKTSLDLNEARDTRDDGVWGCSGISWTICKQSAPRSRQITTPTPHRSIFTDQRPSPAVSKHWR